MAEQWKPTEQEIKALLEKLAQSKQKLDLPAISPQAAKQMALHIQKMLKQDLH
jgi:hypothetical protein